MKSRLRVRAACHGRSMEAEAREILKQALIMAWPPNSQNLAQSIRRYIDPLGGVELAIPARRPVRKSPKLT